MTKPNDLPSHASPLISPVPRPAAQYLQSWTDLDNDSRPETPGLPDNLISPAFTPPLTPSIPGTPSGHHSSHSLFGRHEPKSYPVDTSLEDASTTRKPRLLETLPKVECVVRARIPTTSGAEMFLHLYQNDVDNKEHLAIVFGNSIRSRTLDAERPGETEMDRMIRGAYVGRLRPGRMSSRKDDEEDLRRKVLKGTAPGPESKSRKRSGSALKIVETVPENTAETPLSSAEPASQEPSKDQIPTQDQPAETQSQTQVPPTTSSSSSSQAHLDPPSQQELESKDELSDLPDLKLKPPLVRIHSECYTGETAWSARCDCGEQLDEAARLMSMPLHHTGSNAITSQNTALSEAAAPQQQQQSTGGVIVYLRQEGRGIGLLSKLKAYNLQDLGSDTVEANLLLRHPADARSYGLATSILRDLGLGTDSDPIKTESQRGIRLLTNNPDKVRAVEGPGKEVRVVERVAMVPLSWRSGGKEGVQGAELQRYLETKVGRMGHMIHEP